MNHKNGAMRADSHWSELKPEQMETLEQWLFVEKITYEEARKRAERDWGIVSSVSSVGRYYRRRRAQQAVQALVEAAAAADAIDESAAKTERLRSAAMKLIGKRLLEDAMDGSETTELARLGRILLQSQEREIQHERLALARERFEFNAATAALAELPNLKQMNEEDAAREKERVVAIKRRLFGNRKPITRPATEEKANAEKGEQKCANP